MDFQAFDKISYGLYLVSSIADGRDAGCVINTFGQVTVAPVQATIALHRENFTTACIRRSGLFTVTALTEHTPMELIGAFGFSSSRDTDKFKNFATARDENGVLYVTAHAAARFTCKVTGTLDAGTHLIFLGEVQHWEVMCEEAPMTYAYYHSVKKGLTPPKASSYRPKATATGWRCTVCGYIYENETLPEDFICPICKQPRTVFEKNDV